ncbi:AP2-like ethylene-responsive transcription factor At2g41710 isoform X2 [Pistacia vera]|uniref:AP2-like ethylene-responsive transcription factor At2g41710 isoform X2 n=1 Tax=Pistacia vera TaxID=55513 RepID=UPI001262F0F7|nr:AP2-like ethylene-responsive transcription factor At2g41710 isoform X2 [Pistacia vera]
MASSSSDHALKHELGGGSGGGGGGGETSEAVIANDQLLLYRGLKKAKKERGCTAKERISKMPPCTAGKRSSIYRGVTRHRWTGRYEAHLWDKSTWNQNQNKKGKQVYLGAYDDEEAAARAYDLAALKYWGPGTLINFPVTDYTRDLDEMQNVSREEYLASLRRKSSGFSRGISKYRGLSSRWDSSLARMAGSEYFSNVHYGTGDDPSTESEYVGGFCLDRKIDLTSYIKWWGPNKARQAEAVAKSSEEAKHGCAEDISGELKKSEMAIQCSEPYQMPRLGTSLKGKNHKGSTQSAMSILSQSAAYKSFQEKALKKHENNNENDENENKNIINKMDYGKAIEKSTSHDGGSERLVPAIGMTGGLSLQKNVFPLAPFLSAPLLTAYNTIDPLVDPILWTSLVPPLPTGLSRNPEVTKTESSSTYTFFRPEE